MITDLHLETATLLEDANPNNLHLETETIKHVPISIETTPPSGSGGGTSGLVVPQAIIVAIAKVKIVHVGLVSARIRLIIQRIHILYKLPVKIIKVAFSLKSVVSGLNIESFVSGLSLKISSTGIDIDDSQS